MENKKYMYALDLALGQQRKKKHMLLEYGAGNILNIPNNIVKELLTISEMDIYEKIKYINIEEKWQELQKMNISFTYYGAPDYPKKLLNIPDPPFALYYKGELPKEDSLNVGIIGARQNSEYGSYMARMFAGTLAKNDINVISGMALGIDGISQREALKEGGKSYAVLGCGVDIAYPRSNAGLYNDLIIKGGVISEYPPKVQPIAKLFPPRNRIISGLSDCILVVEARQKSGTLITVDMALEQGKDVFVIPGRCTDSLSEGCNGLIRNGAFCACKAEDIIETMGWMPLSKTEAQTKQRISELSSRILSAMDFDPVSQDELLQKINLKKEKITVAELSKGLLELELNDLIQRKFGQYCVKKGKF